MMKVPGLTLRFTPGFWLWGWIGLFMLPNLGLAQSPAPPNILLILTDDQAWGTLGCYGGRIVKTPHLDRLANQGARFASAYVTSQCTPTRATILTGQYTARNRMWHVIRWYGCPWARMEEPTFRENLARGTPTIASELKSAGYVTGIVGKWHLTDNLDGNYQGLRQQNSHHYGFDFAPPILGKKEFQEGGDRGVATLTRQAIEFIKNNRNRPWFCYLSHHMIHGKVVAPKELVQKYRKLGYGDEGPNRAVYLAGLKAIDNSVSRLMQQLDELGEADETVVIFLSDNGGIDERLEHRTLKRPHPEHPRLKPNLVEYDNSPLRAGKGSIYEGGVRVPMIARWPGNIKAGTTIQEPVHAIDIAPTLFAMAGHQPPNDLKLDGVDLTNLLIKGRDSKLDQRPIYQYSPFYDLNWGLTPCASMRKGDYKLIEFFGDRFDSQHQYITGHHLELYDLANDLGETENIASQNPQRTAALLDELHDWMDDCDVKATEGNLHYDPDRAFETTNQKPTWFEN